VEFSSVIGRLIQRTDARSIYQRLERTFGSRNVFMDVDKIPKGRDFTHVLETTLRKCAVMLVLIGNNWLSVTDERGQQRLNDPNDFVRRHILGLQSAELGIIATLE